MRKIQRYMIAIFLGGVFLAGLGTGLAFSEFSSFTYGGETVIGETEMKTENFDYAFELEDDEKLQVYNYGAYKLSESDIVTTPSVPENTVRFLITYNAMAVKPHLEYSEENRFIASSYYYINDDLRTFMTCKDQILKDIKNKKIGSYTTRTIDEIKVLVNPASKASISIN